VWGPVVEDGTTFYYSEPNGASEAEVPGCRLIWIYDSSQNCSTAYTVNDNGTAEIAADGTLILREGLVVEYELPPAGISIIALQQLPNCPDDITNTTGGDTGGNTGGDVVIGGDLTALSCAGNRVWGPIQNGQELIYLTEAAGDDTAHDCGLLLTFNPAQNCIAVNYIADDASATINRDGSVDFRFDDTALDLGVAGISFTELAQIPLCP